MKQTGVLFILALMLFGCADNKQQAKEVYKDVMALHDSTMAGNEQVIEHKMQLDSMVKQNLPQPVKDSAQIISNNLAKADDAMSAWMHQFEPDYSAKPHDKAMQYLTDQKKKIQKVDSMTKAALDMSDAFLSKYKK